MSCAQEPHILIIGAGVTGLLIAHGLRQAGIKYTIFEHEEHGRQRPKEWTMGIHWALPLLEDLLPPHLASRIVSDASVDKSLDYDQAPNNGGYIYDGVSGEMLKDLAVSGRIIRLSRKKLRALCSEDIDINYSHTLETITCSNDDTMITARFANGETCSGTLLIGCDGPQSMVRARLFSDDPAQGRVECLSDVVTMSTAIAYLNAETARYIRESSHPLWSICISPDIYVFMSMQDVPDPARPETWSSFILASWIGQADKTLINSERLQILKGRARHLAEPFRTAILEIPDSTEIPYSELSYWIAQPWDTLHSRITLAGDAAHPMLPFRGQGANHAIQDAYSFVEIVKKIAAAPPDSGKEAQARLIKEYSDEVAKRGAEETVLSKKNARMAIAYHDFRNSPYFKQGLSRS